MPRSLASVQKISAVKPIEGADAIELVLIEGWQCVAKKGEFKPDDLCVYFEVDSYLPLEERYEFLRRSSYRNNEFMGEGFRVKTMRMRGELSQGLALPVSEFGELGLTVFDGQDVTEALRVRKWELPEVTGNTGTFKPGLPHDIPKTDETRIQSKPVLLEHFAGKPYYVTTKMDGTSITVYKVGDQLGICGRNIEYVDDGTSKFWQYMTNNGVKDKVSKLDYDVVFQGEYCGEGVQKNRLKLMSPQWYVFNVFTRQDSNSPWVLADFDRTKAVCEITELQMVPIEEEGGAFKYTLDELLERAKGKYPSGSDKEGIVIRLKSAEYFKYLQHRSSFKVINNDFLLKEKD